MTWSVQEQLTPVAVSLLTGPGGVDYSPCLVSFNLTMKWGHRTTGTLILRELGNDGSAPEDLLVPIGSGSLNPRHHQELASWNRSVAQTFVMSYEVAGMRGITPPLTVLTGSYNGWELELSMDDLSRILDQDGLAMDDILADQGDVAFANETIEAIGAFVGLTVHSKLRDFRIRQLRRSEGTPRSWMDKLKKIRQAGEVWVGNVLELHEPKRGTPGASGKTWTYVDEMNIEDLQFAVDITGMKNQATITRLEPQSGIIGQADCQGGQCLGRTLKISFDRAASSIQPFVEKVVNGGIVDYVYFDRGDNVVSTNTTGFYQGVPAVRVEATYEAHEVGNVPGGGQASDQPGLTTWTPGYSVVFYGSPAAGGQQADTSYTFTQSFSGTSMFGTWIEANIEDVTIFDSVTAQEFLTSWLEESNLTIVKARFRTPYFNPLMRPGDWLNLTDYMTGMVTEKWFVDAVHHIQEEGGPLTLEVDCVRGP